MAAGGVAEGPLRGRLASGCLLTISVRPRGLLSRLRGVSNSEIVPRLYRECTGFVRQLYALITGFSIGLSSLRVTFLIVSNMLLLSHGYWVVAT